MIISPRTSEALADRRPAESFLRIRLAGGADDVTGELEHLVVAIGAGVVEPVFDHEAETPSFEP